MDAYLPVIWGETWGWLQAAGGEEAGPYWDEVCLVPACSHEGIGWEGQARFGREGAAVAGRRQGRKDEGEADASVAGASRVGGKGAVGAYPAGASEDAGAFAGEPAVVEAWRGRGYSCREEQEPAHLGVVEAGQRAGHRKPAEQVAH